VTTPETPKPAVSSGFRVMAGEDLNLHGPYGRYVVSRKSATIGR